MTTVDEIQEDLETLSREIKSAEEEQAQIKGRLLSEYDTLNDNFDVSTVKQGEKLAKEKKAEMETLGKEIQELYTELKENYDW